MRENRTENINTIPCFEYFQEKKHFIRSSILSMCEKSISFAVSNSGFLSD